MRDDADAAQHRATEAAAVRIRGGGALISALIRAMLEDSCALHAILLRRARPARRRRRAATPAAAAAAANPAAAAAFNPATSSAAAKAVAASRRRAMRNESHLLQVLEEGKR